MENLGRLVPITDPGLGALVASTFARQPVPFTRPHATSNEIAAVVAALQSDRHAGNGPRTAACQRILEALIAGSRALITQSCTAALEMAALLIDLKHGDEVIMPSWTFASTANAVVLRGAVPVFVDIDPHTLNMDTTAAEAAITKHTRAILCVHYAGVACDMDRLIELCLNRNLVLIEDAAQAVGSAWRNRPLGGIGDFGALSFHATKNISSGEGGALLVNRKGYVDRAEMIWEKGTDRLRFMRGETSSYDWLVAGSSFLPSEITAAFLEASLRAIEAKTADRLSAWNYYDQEVKQRGLDRFVQLPTVPEHASHNGHIYHVRHRAAEDILEEMHRLGVSVTSHYRPLHLSPAGKTFGRVSESCAVTESTASSLLRLPLFPGITRSDQDFVVDCLEASITALRR